jgi:hypothetical protein
VRSRGAARAEAAYRGLTQGRVRVWLEVGEGPDGRVPPGGEREREREGADWAAGPGEGEAKWLARLDCAVEKKRKGLLGRALQEEGERRGKKEREWASWAGGEEKERGGGEGNGPGQKRKRGRKRKILECI